MGRRKEQKPTLEEFASKEEMPASVSILRNLLARAQRDLRMEKGRTDAILDAARSVLEPLRIAPDVTPYRSPKRKKHAPLVHVASVNDLQAGKVTATYSLDVLRTRMLEYFRRVALITDIMRAKHPVDDLRVYCNGDLVEGEGIFPGQSWEVNAGALEQATIGAQIIATAIASVASQYRTVEVLVTAGNHGRSGREWNPRSNWDLVLGHLLKHELSKIRNVNVEVCEHWYKVSRVLNTGILVTHGDRIRSGGRTPDTAIVYRSMGWVQSIDEPWDLLLLGHFHQFIVRDWNGKILMISPSPESDNEYARGYLGGRSRPGQLSFFIHPERGLHSTWPVWLE